MQVSTNCWWRLHEDVVVKVVEELLQKLLNCGASAAHLFLGRGLAPTKERMDGGFGRGGRWRGLLRRGLFWYLVFCHVGFLNECPLWCQISVKPFGDGPREVWDGVCWWMKSRRVNVGQARRPLTGEHGVEGG